jgi:hypothetical protein
VQAAMGLWRRCGSQGAGRWAFPLLVAVGVGVALGVSALFVARGLEDAKALAGFRQGARAHTVALQAAVDGVVRVGT